MRLLDTATGEFRWVEDPRQEHYAILSHVWARPGEPDYVPEPSYNDLLKLQAEARAQGSQPIEKFPEKLLRFCQTAAKDGFKLGWVDTCCIDKTSSSELSEAINSMYSWYGYSGVCYAFLRDTKSRNGGDLEWIASFQRSEWFRRGWTLQELIASRIVIFVSNSGVADRQGQMPGWEVLGSKHSLAADISSKTGIDISVLTFETLLEEIPIARRMAWMHSRETTRLEDEAYCLMGIFGVNMQTNYGEGRYAFIRLQEKILSQTADQTIFSWGRILDNQPSVLTFLSPNSSNISSVSTASPVNLSIGNPITPPSYPDQYLLAPSPKAFDSDHSANIVQLSRAIFQERLGISGPLVEDLCQVFDITPYGIRTNFPLLNIASPGSHLNATTHCAILACEDPAKGLLALLLRPRKDLTGNEFFAGAIVGSLLQMSGPDSERYSRDSLVWDHYYRLAYIPAKQLKLLCASSSSIFNPHRPSALSSVYIPHCQSHSALEEDSDSNNHNILRETSEKFEVYLCSWSKKVLEQDGYNVLLRGQSNLDNLGDKPFTTSEALQSRSRSTIYENPITISNKNSDIFITIRVDRCECDLARRLGLLRVMVSSRSPHSLDGKYTSSTHRRDHPLHVHSWSFNRRFAWRDIEFDSPVMPVSNSTQVTTRQAGPPTQAQAAAQATSKSDSNDSTESRPPPRLSLRLTLSSIMSSLEDRPAARRYRLGVELRKLVDSEVQSPRQPLPLNDPQYLSSRAQSDSPSEQLQNTSTAQNWRIFEAPVFRPLRRRAYFLTRLAPLSQPLMAA